MQLANLARCDAEVAIAKRKFADDEVRSQLNWLADNFNCYIAVGQGPAPGVSLVWRDRRPELVALGPSLLRDVARGNNESDVLLGNHAPKVMESVFEGALRRDYLAVTDSTKWPIHEVSIDVAIDKRVTLSDACAGDQDGSRVLVSSDIGVSVSFIDCSASVHAEILMDISVSAGCQWAELAIAVFLLAPDRDWLRDFQILRALLLQLLPKAIRNVPVVARPCDDGGLWRHSGQLFLE